MIELFGTIATVLAVTGVLLNNRRRINCFYLWLISNSISAALHAYIGLWSLCVRDVIFFVLAIEGIYHWRKKPQTSGDDDTGIYNIDGSKDKTTKQFFRDLRRKNEAAKQKTQAQRHHYLEQAAHGRRAEKTV